MLVVASTLGCGTDGEYQELSNTALSSYGYYLGQGTGPIQLSWLQWIREYTIAVTIIKIH